jgi:hypothetical protein
MPAMRVALALALTLPLGALAPPTSAQEPTDGRGDATVVAIIDSGISPYHWDFLASKMPQAQDANLSNDLPLGQAPDTWLPGFPSPASFASYQALNLTLEETNRARSIRTLDTADTAKWNEVKQTTATEVNYYWIPRTKIIGALTFSPTGKIHTAGSNPANTHGHGTSSVSVGNMFGTCPQCLLVFIQYGNAATGEAAIDWAMSQPWIDVISNSYGFSLVERDRLYSGSNTELQRQASERGQTIFFSAGNGMTNTFTIPNSTLFSSQEGPDWIVTVGAVTPNTEESYTGHGKPADVSGIGSGYPSSYASTTVGGRGTNFGGTSNATPQVAGTYSRALYLARRNLLGDSRIQADGVIATGGGFVCGEARADCELGDGNLTVGELRTRLFHGAVHTPGGMNVGGLAGGIPPIGESEFLNEGHGTYTGLLKGEETFATEFDRIMGPLEGRAGVLSRPGGELQWMTVDSFCRQEIWGDWKGGYFIRGATALPGADQAYPLRSALETVCPHLFPPV